MSCGFLQCLGKLVQRFGGLVKGLLPLLGIRRFLSLLHRLFGPLGRILDLCGSGIRISGQFSFGFVSDGSRVGKVSKSLHRLLGRLSGFLLLGC